jgi:hypothetical protein
MEICRRQCGGDHPANGNGEQARSGLKQQADGVVWPALATQVEYAMGRRNARFQLAQAVTGVRKAAMPPDSFARRKPLSRRADGDAGLE